VAELSDPRLPGATRGAPLFANYTEGKAPAICVDGPHHDSRDEAGYLMEHGRVGAEFAKLRNAAIGEAETYSFPVASEAAAEAVHKTTGCDKECIKKQLEQAHADLGVGPESDCRRSPQKADVDIFKEPTTMTPIG
jgi:hypothetical protein